jgi:EAL domain-containing protein (putative c-di-GMP-specific phosphodiesterase class I)
MNFLNIDRSLIFRLGAEPQDTAIVSAMINLAHALGWEVTAEGVETAEQLARLRELGCDMAQGYHLWEPLTGEEVLAVLAVGKD